MGAAPSPSATIAQRLIVHEAKGQQDPQALADAAEQTCVRLRDRLVPLIGPEGFRVLLANAVDLVRTEHPFLQPIESRADLNGCFERLADAVRGRDSGEALAGANALIARFIELLASFIGEALTLRLVHGAWPDILWEDTGADERGSGR